MLVDRTDIQDGVIRAKPGDGFHFNHFLLGLAGDFTDIHVSRGFHNLIENRKVEVSFFRFDLRFHGFYGRAFRNHAAIFRHGAGKIFSADFTRQVDDVFFVMGDQRTQHQGVGDVVDQTQVGQRLAGHLAQRFAGYQRLYAVAFRDAGGRTDHHALQHHTHLAVIDFFKDFAHHRFEINGNETDAVRAAKAAPQIVRHLANADFMSRTAQVEEAVMHATAATHQHVAGYAGIEAAGNQRQHIFLGADGEATLAFVTGFHQQQAIVFDFEIDRDIRVLQFYFRGFDMLIQATADVAFYLNGAKLMFAATFYAHAKRFAFQLVAPVRQRLLENIVQAGKRHIVDFKNMVDAGNAGQRVADFRRLVFIFGADHDMVPVADNGEVFVVMFKYVTDVSGQDFNKAQTHRLAFNCDFREQFNDKLHGGNGSLASPEGYKRSTARQQSRLHRERASISPSL